MLLIFIICFNLGHYNQQLLCCIKHFTQLNAAAMVNLRIHKLIDFFFFCIFA